LCSELCRKTLAQLCIIKAMVMQPSHIAIKEPFEARRRRVVVDVHSSSFISFSSIFPLSVRAPWIHYDEICLGRSALSAGGISLPLVSFTVTSLGPSFLVTDCFLLGPPLLPLLIRSISLSQFSCSSCDGRFLRLCSLRNIDDLSSSRSSSLTSSPSAVS
jgi:hypothetical protein